MTWLQPAVLAARQLGDEEAEGVHLGNLGLVYADKGEWERAIEMYERSLEIEERVGDVHGMAQTWGNLGLLYESQGDRERAAKYLAQAYLVFDRLGAAPDAREASSILVRVTGSGEAANAYLANLTKGQARSSF